MDRESILDLLRERAALMNIPDEQVYALYASYDKLPNEELRQLLDN